NETHDADVFGVAAAGWLEAGGYAGTFVLLALREGAMAASVTIQAGNVVVQSDSLSDVESTHERTSTNDGAGGFVAKYPWRRHGAELDFLDVGGTDPASRNFDEQFMRANAGH